MVKKWIIISVIFVLLVVGCGFEYKFVNSSFDALAKQLEEYQPLIDADKEHIDTAQNIAYVENLHDSWHKKVKVLKALIWHTGIKDIEIGLARIQTYTEENDYTEAYTELLALIDYVKHYSDDFDLSLENLL